MICTMTASGLTLKWRTTASVISFTNARFCSMVRPSIAWT
jgi:hypothetical protein